MGPVFFITESNKMRIYQKHKDAAKDVWEDKLTNEEIAKKYGVVRETISVWKNDPDFRVLLDEIDRHYRRAAQRSALRASETMLRVQMAIAVDGDQPALARIKAAKNVTETAGIEPATQVELTGSEEKPLGVKIVKVVTQGEQDG